MLWIILFNLFGKPKLLVLNEIIWRLQPDFGMQKQQK